MKNFSFLIFLFFSFSLFSQKNELDSVKIIYAVQIFSSSDENATINEASTLLDENIIEEVHKNTWRVLILADSFEKSIKILQIYKESYSDCFIVEYKNKKTN